MKELERLREGLMNSSTLLMKDCDNGLECSFVKEGLVNKTVKIENEILATALRRAGVNGILEGLNFEVFRNTFDSFSLRVKAKSLYEELSRSNSVFQSVEESVATV